LLYIPQGLWGYVSHFFFFLSTALLGYGLFSTVQDIVDRSVSMDDFDGLIAVGAMTLFAQRWGAMQWRRSEGIECGPRKLRLGLLWFPANSFLGLVANAYLITNIFSVIRAFMPAGSPPLLATALIPEWQYPFLICVGAATIPAAYFWPGVEHGLFTGRLAAPSPKKLLRQLNLRPSPERAAGLLVLVLLTLWVFALLLDFTRIPLAASAPDGGVATIGLEGASAEALAALIFLGILPWLPVYRGISALLTD